MHYNNYVLSCQPQKTIYKKLISYKEKMNYIYGLVSLGTVFFLILSLLFI